jgi:hypothetical protein
MEDEIAALAVRQLEAGLRYKSERMKKWQIAFDLYNNKPRKALQHRSHLVVPVMGGFVDTLKSKIHNPPKLKYGYNDLADLRRAAKMQAAYEQTTSITTDNWAIKDLAGTTSAIFTARAIFKMLPNKTGGELAVVDPYDFITEPNARGLIEQHKCHGEVNVLLTKTEIDEGVKAGEYDKDQVQMLLGGNLAPDISTLPTQQKSMNEITLEKERRLRALGLNPDIATYVGEPTFNCVEWHTYFKGKKYTVVMDLGSRIWIKVKPLAETYFVDDTPYDSWSPNFDYWNFWPKSNTDDMIYLAEGIQLSVNQLFDSVNELLWPQLLVDPKHIVDQEQLEWRPRGIIEVDRRGEPGAIDQFAKVFAPSSERGAPQIAMNLIQFLKGIGATDTPVNAEMQGNSQEKLLGISVQNLQQAASKLRIYDDVRKHCWVRIGMRKWHIMRELTPEDMMVKMIGTKGVGWEKEALTKGDLKPLADFDISVTGGDSEAQMDEQRKRARQNSNIIVANNPILSQQVNVKALAEDILGADRDPDEVRMIMDKENQGDRELISRAETAIQDILDGKKKPELVWSATKSFIQHIVEFATKSHEDLDQKDFEKLMAYAEAHKEIVIRNVINQARADQFSASLNQQGIQKPGAMAQGAGSAEMAPEPAMQPQGSLPAPPTMPSPMNPAL